MEKASPDDKNLPSLTLSKAWIWYSFLDKIASTDDERKAFLKTIYSELNQVATTSTVPVVQSEALLKQGLLLFKHD